MRRCRSRWSTAFCFLTHENVAERPEGQLVALTVPAAEPPSPPLSSTAAGGAVAANC